MKEKVKNAVKEYQCFGCVNGPALECYQNVDSADNDLACKKHCAGTTDWPSVGRIFLLGLPKGFNRLGACENTKINIFEKLEDGWGYDKFNFPVWKHLDEHGNVLVRGLNPRINYPWIHIFLENCMDKIGCIEITKEDMAEMD